VTRQRNQSLIAILVVLALITGCHVDPNVRKARYLESGKRFDAQGKFREAAIQFLEFAESRQELPEAHYELAHAYEHLGRSAEATSELTRTVELQPSNYKAQVELGNLLFANGKTGQAQVMANAVMAKQPNNPGFTLCYPRLRPERARTIWPLPRFTRLWHSIRARPSSTRTSRYFWRVTLPGASLSKTNWIEQSSSTQNRLTQESCSPASIPETIV